MRPIHVPAVRQPAVSKKAVQKKVVQEVARVEDLCTKEECMKWMKNTNIHPRTQKRVIRNSPLYKKLESQCNAYFTNTKPLGGKKKPAVSERLARYAGLDINDLLK
jgi:hypothetical protein